MELKKYKYFLKDKPNNFVELEVTNEVFYPTATSQFLINAAKDNIKTSGNLLDLGCGIGIVGIAVYLNGVVEKLFASDISKNATILTKKNALSLNVPIEVICGDKLECWIMTSIHKKPCVTVTLSAQPIEVRRYVSVYCSEFLLLLA